MFQTLLVLFILTPIVEIWLIVRVHTAVAESGGVDTAWLVTISSIVLTGILGSHLARAQGLQTLRSYNDALRQGRFPGDAIIDGLMILVGGALLLTPGYATDALGFSLLIPWTRALHRRVWKSYLNRHVQDGVIRFETRFSPDQGRSDPTDRAHQPRSSEPLSGQVIDVDPVRPDEEPGRRSHE